MRPRLPEPRMRESFRRELRDRLLSEAQTALAPGARRGTAWTFLRPALGVGLAAILLVAGAGTAAAGSLPGDPAFGLKRAVEDLQVNLTFDDVRRVVLLAQIADRRLQELQQVASRDDREKQVNASQAFAEAVSAFRHAADRVQQNASSGKDQGKLMQVQGVIDESRDKHESLVEELRQQVDDDRAKDALERAKDEENKGSQGDSDAGKTPRPQRSRTPEPSRTPRPSVTPRPAEPQRTDEPRETDRGETDRPASPAPSFTPRPTPTPSATAH